MDYVDLYSRVYQEPNYRMGKHRLDRLASFLEGKVGRYIDVGCGRAESLDLADSWGFLAIGFEIVPALCQRDDVVQVADIAKIPTGLDCDYMSCLDVLEHIEEGHIPAAVRALAALKFKEALIGVSWHADRFGPKLGVGHLHVTIQPPEWWLEQLTLAFQGCEISVELTGRDTAYFVIRRTTC